MIQLTKLDFYRRKHDNIWNAFLAKELTPQELHPVSAVHFSYTNDGTKQVNIAGGGGGGPAPAGAPQQQQYAQASQQYAQPPQQYAQPPQQGFAPPQQYGAPQGYPPAGYPPGYGAPVGGY